MKKLSLKVGVLVGLFFHGAVGMEDLSNILETAIRTSPLCEKAIVQEKEFREATIPIVFQEACLTI